jgi:excisionase family DNA binding protein
VKQAALKLVGKPRKRRRDGAGFSIPGAAEELGISYKTLRDAIAMGQVRCVPFGKINRISRAEVERIKQLFGAKTQRDWLMP